MLKCTILGYKSEISEKPFPFNSITVFVSIFMSISYKRAVVLAGVC